MCLLSGPVVVRLAEIAEPLYANVNVNENEFRSAPAKSVTVRFDDDE